MLRVAVKLVAMVTVACSRSEAIKIKIVILKNSHSMYSKTNKIGQALPKYHTCIVNRIDYYLKWLLMHYYMYIVDTYSLRLMIRL